MRFFEMKQPRQNRVVAVVLGLAMSLTASAATARARTNQDQTGNSKRAEIERIMQRAEALYQEGERAYAAQEYDRARRLFDQAVDEILIGAIDVRSDDELKIYYRKLIEKVNRYQVAALELKEGGFSEQRYEPSPLDKIASLSDADLEEAGDAGDGLDVVANTHFNFNFTMATPVNQFINYFTRGRGRATMEAGLSRSARYREMAERIFKEEGVPTDLIWLAQVESGWNPYALSSAAARGIWQFIPATGARFGLTQNQWIDERSNPEKSTRAAARYLKWLADRYNGNWTLALAAYNTGEGNVDSAIARSGTRDFWRMHSAGYLARETRNYVPAILAVVTIAKNPKKYGFNMPSAFPYRYQTQTITKQTDLRALGKKLNVTYSQLLELNPELHRGVTPPGKHVIRIPVSAISGQARLE